jgi:hypothetical protein
MTRIDFEELERVFGDELANAARFEWLEVPNDVVVHLGILDGCLAAASDDATAVRLVFWFL